MEREHYPKAAQLVGETLRCAVTLLGHWLALAAGAFASSWYGVPALAGLARHRPARWLANPGPRRLKPELRTNNSRMRPLGGALGAF